MKSITSKRFVSVSVFLVLNLVGALILAGVARSGASGNLEPSQPSQRIQMFDIGSGSQAYNFQLGRETKTRYLGAAPLRQAVEAGQVEPRAMVSDDFNGDGMGDLVIGYAYNGVGVLGLRQGNLQAIAPTDAEVFEGIQHGRYPSPFLTEVSLYSLPEAPDFLQVGDFNADGHADVMAGARGGQRIYLFAGDGRGHLGDPEAFDLPGLLTAMQAGREQLGRFTSLAIGLLAPDGAEFSVYHEGGEGLAAEPESHTMPSEVTALALGDLNQDGTPDVAAVAGNEVAVVYQHEEINIVSSVEMDQVTVLAAGSPSKARAERTTFPFVIRGVAIGNFVFDRGHQIELALLADDGAIHLVDKGQPDTRAFTQRDIDFMQEQHKAFVNGQQDMGSLTTEMNTLVRPSSRFSAGAAWNVIETLSTGAALPYSGAPGLLQSSRMSGLALDDLLVGNAADNSVQVVKNKQEILKLKLSNAEALAETTSVKAEGAPLAAVSMRLGLNTHPGIVILQADQIEPLVSINSVTTAYSTTTFTDFPITPGVGGVNVNTGAIVGGAGNGFVSLRSAIIASNYKGGSNSISLSNGTYTLTQGPFDDEFNTFGAAMETGDLDIIDLQFGGFPALTAVTLTGAGRDTTIIQMGTLSPAGAGGINKDRVLESNNFVIPQHGTSVSLSNLTIQNGNAPRTPAPDNYNTKGGGIQFDGFDSPSNTNLGSLTLTNCKFTSNTSAGQGGGVLAIFGDLTVQTTSIISSNTTTFAAGGGIQHSGGNVITTTINISGSTIESNNAPDSAFGSAGGFDSVGANAFNITNGSVIQNNTGGVASGPLGGGGVHIGNSKNIVFSNSTITGNTAKHNGGGIWVSAADGVTKVPSTITLTTMNVTGNTADSDNSGAGDGGGLYVLVGTATVQTMSHIDGNSAVNGGGIFTGWIGTAEDATAGLTVQTGSTIGSSGAGNGNSAKNNGGSIAINPGAATTFGPINLNSLTFTNNTANSDNSGGGDGGAIYVGNGNLTSLNNCTIDSNVANGGTGDGIRQTGGTITGAGTLNFNGGDSISLSGGTFTSTSGTLNLSGNFINSGGNFVHNSGTVVFNGTGAQSLGGTTSSTFNNVTVNKGSGTLTLGVNTTLATVAGGGNLSVSAGNFDLSTFTINRAAAGGMLTLGANTLLKIGGTNTLPSNYSAHSINSTSTVEYAGASQSVAGLNSSQSYGFLTTSGSGTKTLAAAISVANDLTIGTGTILDVSASNFGLNAAKNWTNNAGTSGFNARSGLVTFNGSGGTQTLTGNTTFFDLTLNNSGATTSFGSTSTTIARNLATNAGTMDGGTSTITFTGNPGAISGANAKNFNNLVINGGVISNTTGGNTTILNDFTNSGGFTQAAGLTTTFSTGADGNHSFLGNKPTTFGNFIISAGNTVDAGIQSFDVVGANFTATGMFTGNTSTVTFNGAVPQTILGDGAKSFSGLTINNANGVTVNDTTPAVDASVSGLLTLTTNLSIASGAILQQSGASAGAGDVIGTVRRTDLDGTARAFGNPNVTIRVDTGTAPNPMDITLVKAVPTDFTTSVTRTYTLAPTGGSGISATVKLHYLNAELNGNAEPSLGLWKKVGAVWTIQGRSSAVDTVNKSVTLSGVTSFSDWTLAALPDVSVTVLPTSVLEDSGTMMAYTFARTGSTASPVTVNFSVGGTAVFIAGAGTDYTQTGADTFTPTTGTVTIGVGNPSATVNVTPSADTTVEPNETVILTVTSGTTYSVAASPNNIATGTITNDDADVSVAVSPLSTSEDGAGNLVYTFTRLGETASALTVNFSIGGTATPPAGPTPDYSQTGAATFTALTGSVNFVAGNPTATVTIDPTGDNTVESDETVILTVTTGTGYNVGTPASATGTITNDDADVSLAVSPSSSLEDTGPNMVYTFTRTGFTGGPLTINFSVGGTAVFIAGAGTDYTQTGAASFTPTTGTVTFTGTNTTATVTIDPATDATGEPDETVILTVVSGTGYNAVAPISATGTILNDDTSVSVVVSPLTSLEDTGPNMVYTFARTGDTSTALVVNFSVGGTAIPPAGATPDYTQTGADTFTTTTGTVTIPVGQPSASVTVDPMTDITVEPDETVVLTVTSGSGYVAGAPSTATGTITNDDTDVSVTVSPASVSENSGSAMTYTFSRSGVTTGTLTVNITIGGTATFTTDYTQTGADTFTPPTGTVTFANNSSTATVPITPVGDNTVETDETVILGVAAGTGYNVAAVNNTATGTITNDDATVSVAVSPASVLEDSAGVLTYTFTRSGFTGGPLTVNFDTIGSTASAASDYAVSGTGVTFVPGTGLGTVTFTGTNTTTTMTVDPTTDGIGEQNETVTVNIAAGSNYTATAPTSATGTIQDDDTSVGVTVAPTSVLENSGTAMVYTFTRAGDTTTALSVNFTATGTATPNGAGADYVVSGSGVVFDPMTGTGTIAIGSGVTMVTANITPNGDMTVEPDETVIITVIAGMGYIPNSGTPSATGTISNDDTEVSVTVSPASVAENSGSPMTYTFTRTGVTAGTLTANFTIGGTATFTTDFTQTGADTFTPPTGTVTFANNSSTATVPITPVPDGDVEADETVILGVAAGSGYNVAAVNNMATGTITNDDTDVTMSISPASVGEDGAISMVYTFTRSGVTMAPLTVNYTIGGTATFTNDYTQTGAGTFDGSTGTVVIADGSSMATVTLTPVNDVKVEGNETVSLTLSASANYDIGTPGPVTGTIVDNDTATVAFAASSSNAPEQTTPHTVGVVLTITGNGTGTPMLERNVSVNVQNLLTGTATNSGTDYSYSPNPQTVTFNSGDIAQTKNVSLTIVNDSLSEGNETINLALNTLVDGTGSQASLGTAAHTVTIVDNDIDLQVTKAESADPVAAGGGVGNLVYTVKVKNIGLTPATGVVLSEALVLPAGVTLVSITPSGGTTVTPVVPNVSYTWTVGSLGVNGEATLTVVLTVGSGTATGTNTICDTATVTASGENRVNTGDDTKTECTSVVAQADVEVVSKTDAPDPACVGGDITYTISYRNNGPGPGLNAKMTDAVPANTTLVSASTASPGWGRTDAVPTGGTGNIVFAKASVANGETATFQVMVRINTGTVHGTVIGNTATASSDLLDPVSGNNNKSAMTTVDPTPPTFVNPCPTGLNVAPSAVTCPFTSGGTVNYATPAAMDNCPGVAVVCSPPSGSMFPQGTTTVSCTATDAAGNTAMCSFPVTMFSLCLQDDSNPGNVVLINVNTGAYRFCCNGTVVATGTGTRTIRGCAVTVSEIVGNKKVQISADGGVMKGTASLQLNNVTICTITDKNITNNSCNCP